MPKTEKKVMLIVEDDEILLRALYLLFHKGDYTIASATDGDTALKMTQRLKPDVVLLDLLLPKMNGFDYLKFMKADTNIKNTPVIVLSNLGDKESIDKAKGLGALDYFIKSDTDLTTLDEKVKKIIKG
jgi:DNA-binding response OmpR family regulator